MHTLSGRSAARSYGRTGEKEFAPLAIGFDLRSRPILGGVLVLALASGVWGIYAWRALRPQTPVAAGTDAGGSLTPLRATRPISEIISKIESENSAQVPQRPIETDLVPTDPVMADAAGISSVRANTPPSGQSAVEMTIGRREDHGDVVAAPRGSHFELGRAALARGQLVEARGCLTAALDRGLPSVDEEFIRSELTRLSDALLFSRAANTNDPLTSSHGITAGETLNALAARNKVTEELLGRINKIAEPNHLRVGQQIKVLRGPFRAVIDKSDHRMDLYLGEAYVRSFRVGLGANGYTPTGVWVVNNKLRNPDWTDPNTNKHYLADDPDNPIGERWIGLAGVDGDALGKTGFGIHGTIDPASIGGDKSMGCIRMSAADVNIVFDLFVLNYSRVEIRP